MTFRSGSAASSMAMPCLMRLCCRAKASSSVNRLFISTAAYLPKLARNGRQELAADGSRGSPCEHARGFPTRCGSGEIMRPSRNSCPLVRIGLPGVVADRESGVYLKSMLQCGTKRLSGKENVMDNHMSMSMGAAGWNSPRWHGITRAYSHEQVNRLRGTVHIEHSLARSGAEKLWRMLHRDSYVAALGALTGNQAVEMAAAGLQAIYLSGWQVAADANLSGHMYPDQSLYPVNSVPAVVRAINQALMR